MVPRDCSSDQASSTSSSPLRCLSSDDEHDDCCGKSASSSLEDTLSLTCDDSMSSGMSSSMVDSQIDDDSDGEIDTGRYQSPPSPHILRRRLLPLAPSPISSQSGLDSPLHRKPFNEKVLWKKRSSIRIIWFTMGLAWITYLLAVTADYRWIGESLLAGEVISKEAQEWRRFFRRRAPKVLRKLPSKSSSREYTIRIRGHRVDLVTQSLDFHAQCPSVKAVQVEWTDPKSKLPSFLLGHRSGKVKPFGKPSTPAVFLLDEDLILSCQEIERAFLEWKLDPARLVGFYPFHHDGHPQAASDSSFQLRAISRGGSYSMVSDRAVFIHSLILRSIPAAPPECQHLGMSIIVSNMTSKPPVAVFSKTQAFQQTKKKHKIPADANQRCQHWIQSISASELPEQMSTIVGQGQQ